MLVLAVFSRKKNSDRISSEVKQTYLFVFVVGGPPLDSGAAAGRRLIAQLHPVPRLSVRMVNSIMFKSLGANRLLLH